MHKTDRGLLAILFAVALSVSMYTTAHIYRLNHPRVPAPTVLSASAKTLLTDSSHIRGNRAASFTLVEFADFQCPFCIRKCDDVARLLKTHASELKISFHEYPLLMHPYARQAAQTAEAAGLQAKFWSVCDALMSRKGDITDKAIKDLVRSCGLDAKRFDHDFSGRARNQVEQDITLGDRLGVHGTPTFLLCRPDGSVVRLGALEQAESYLHSPRLR